MLPPSARRPLATLAILLLGALSFTMAGSGALPPAPNTVPLAADVSEADEVVASSPAVPQDQIPEAEVLEAERNPEILRVALHADTEAPQSSPPASATRDLDAARSIEATVRAHLMRYRKRTGLTDYEIRKLAYRIVFEAQRHDLDPSLVLAVMHVESRYNTYAVSRVDAMGLMQILPSTGKWMAGKLDIEWRGPQTLFDPFINVQIGVAYLRELVDRYGSVHTALSAYNWGPGAIDRRIRRGVPLPRIYSQLVLDALDRTPRS